MSTLFYKEHKKTVSRGYTKLMEPSGSLFVLTLILFNFLISFLLRVSYNELRDVKWNKSIINIFSKKGKLSKSLFIDDLGFIGLSSKIEG